MEDQNPTKDTLLNPGTICASVHSLSSYSASASDDNGDGPPCSFSIHSEHISTPQTRASNTNVYPTKSEEDVLEQSHEEVSEPDDEQPPVTWYVTKTSSNDRALYGQNSALLQRYELGSEQSHLCRLCLVRRKRFYCIDCVNGGEFDHSNACYPGNLLEKKSHRTLIEEKAKKMITDIEKKTSARLKSQELAENIKLCRQRINYMQKLIQATKEKNDKTLRNGKKLAAMNDIREQRLPSFIDKASKIRQYTVKYVRQLEKEKLRVIEQQRTLDVLRQCHIRKLFELIFPVDKVIVSSNTNETDSVNRLSLISNSNDEATVIESLMADAMSTSYVHGHGWVTLDSGYSAENSTASTLSVISNTNNDLSQDAVERIVYKIASPYLPADGDYSKFPEMVKSSNDQVQSIIPQENSDFTFPMEFVSSRSQTAGLELSTEDEISSIHTISAGLTFTAQLVAQISAYLDVILPKCFSSNEFGVPVASNYKFAKKVARLNLNIIYLCLINGVPAEEIEATQSLHNLYLLYKYTAHQKPSRNQNIPSNEKLVEQLYELSKVSASAIDKVCPTSDDLLNSDDECRDKEKQKEMDDWEAVFLAGGTCTHDMMAVNWSQLNAQSNSNWTASNSPPSPAQSPGPYGQAANSATSFVSSLIRGFTGATSPTNNIPGVFDPYISPKK